MPRKGEYKYDVDEICRALDSYTAQYRYFILGDSVCNHQIHSAPVSYLEKKHPSMDPYR